MNVMAVPMIDYQGNVIGVLQVVNKKKSKEIRLSPENIFLSIVDYTK